jgi:hypothetical protein
MGRFEDKLAAGMADPEFAAGYAEAKAELANSEMTVSWELCDAPGMTVTGTASGSVAIERPIFEFANSVLPRVMVGRTLSV